LAEVRQNFPMSRTRWRSEVNSNCLSPTENSEGIEKSGDLSCPAVVSRACSHSSWRFFHGSLVGFAAARNWNSRSLHSATNWQSCIASVPAAPCSPRRSPTLDPALPGLAAVPEHRGVGEAGHRGPMAPPRLPPLLALALKVWTALSRSRSS
jgi:hypothetical protein